MSDKNLSPSFKNENEFEKALVEQLKENGWQDGQLQYVTEEDLVKNWAKIIYENNRQIDKLDSYPLTETEMQQIINEVNMMKNPADRNRFINGGEVNIVRDHPDDLAHKGKTVTLKIFDAREIASGKSRYQIVRQPKFKTASKVLGERRGDVMLLINGMPVIHIELKRTGVDVSQAVCQIKRYVHEGVFEKGIFSLVQIFVAMTPENTLYFANPGKEENFNESYRFHWADFNNDPINDWRRITRELLYIPLAHQLVGYYTIADKKDDTLKVLRSYQYNAVNKITDTVHQHNWDSYKQEGGFVWHTTGSGKTMTSFKSAQLIASANKADKVIFMMDRIELSTQSLDEYKGFAGDMDTVSGTENTDKLMALLQSNDRDHCLIVTSIQKMSRLGAPDCGVPKTSIDEVAKKRIVIIVDECHRDVFGKMLMNIKKTFPKALLFGFTGTPIFDDKNENEISTTAIFGKELHRYSITDGITDRNVLGFDLYKVETYHEENLRRMVALYKAGVKDESELVKKEGAKKVYDRWMLEDDMITIEENLPKEVYQSEAHYRAVIDNIMENWNTLSQNNRFHGILAVKSIEEAIAYYRLIRQMFPELKVTSVFNDSIDNSDKGIDKEDAIKQILEEYNAQYKVAYTQQTYGDFKKDVQKRLAHKFPYIGIEREKEKQLDLLIVVSQMLTGYDSKWVNTLYVDKLLDMHNLIQAFSRTNRLFGPDKPFGIIKYYDRPNTMQQNIEAAVDAYSGNRPFGLFVEKLEKNLNEMNNLYTRIKEIFEAAGVEDFMQLPSDLTARREFAVKFNEFNRRMKAAMLQGFSWDKQIYYFTHDDDNNVEVTMLLDHHTYLILLQRYKELFQSPPGPEPVNPVDAIPIETYITESSAGTIDAEYMNTNFVKYVKQLYLEGPGSETTKAAIKELHKSFASLSQRDQLTAIIILHNIQSGDLILEEGKSIMDYIAEFQSNEVRDHIRIMHEATGVDEDMLRDLVMKHVTEANINDFGRFDALRASADKEQAKDFMEKITGEVMSVFKVNMRFANILKNFVLNDADREHIIYAYQHGITLDDVVPAPDPEAQWAEVIDEAEKEQEPRPVIQPEVPAVLAVEVPEVKEDPAVAMFRRIKDVLETEADIAKVTHKSITEVVQSVFKVLGETTLASLDGVNILVMSALSELFSMDNPNFVTKFNKFHILATSFEAYLKKLYFLENGREVISRRVGFEPTMEDALKGLPTMWNLRYNHDLESMVLSRMLERVRSWRNDHSHISPTIQPAVLTNNLNALIVMYFYAASSVIDHIDHRLRMVADQTKNEYNS